MDLDLKSVPWITHEKANEGGKMKVYRGNLGTFLTALTAFLLLGGATSSLAQESSSETKAKLKDIKGNEGQADVDQLITNKKLRAETGSKSKVSVSTFFQYNGGSLESPGAKFRPNITAGSDNTALSGIVGQIGGKFRVGEQTSVSAGVGVRMFSPFQAPIGDDKVFDKEGNAVDRNDVYDPYVGFTYVSKLGGLQSVSSVDTTIKTTRDSRARGYVGKVNGSQTFVKDIGTSGFSVGAAVIAEVAAFDKFTDSAKAASSDYAVGFYPMLEYVFNDTFNFRTVSGIWVFEHVRSASSAFSFEQNVIYQSVGLGISVTRDIYLYPNIQFLPEHMNADRTNVALNANINIF